MRTTPAIGDRVRVTAPLPHYIDTIDVGAEGIVTHVSITEAGSRSALLGTTAANSCCSTSIPTRSSVSHDHQWHPGENATH
jgi:hypothetical protein